jgi:hypothetical protein
MGRSRKGPQGIRKQQGERVVRGPGWADQWLWSGGVSPHGPAARQGAGQNEGRKDEAGGVRGGTDAGVELETGLGSRATAAGSADRGVPWSDGIATRGGVVAAGRASGMLQCHVRLVTTGGPRGGEGGACGRGGPRGAGASGPGPEAGAVDGANVAVGASVGWGADRGWARGGGAAHDGASGPARDGRPRAGDQARKAHGDAAGGDRGHRGSMGLQSTGQTGAKLVEEVTLRALAPGGFRLGPDEVGRFFCPSPTMSSE